MKQKNELPIPTPAIQDSNSFEILRVWIANQGQQVSLRSGVWSDPAAWGIMLADIARHVANSYYEESDFDPAKTLQRIKAGFEAELASPTDVPGGHIT